MRLHNWIQMAPGYLHNAFHFHALEKEMATCSSVLAWRIPGTGEPGGLPSIGSHRVGHDWRNLAAAAAAAKNSIRHRGHSQLMDRQDSKGSDTCDSLPKVTQPPSEMDVIWTQVRITARSALSSEFWNSDFPLEFWLTSPLSKKHI